MKAVSSEQATQSVLLADIGGTSARFAILPAGIVRKITRMALGNHCSFRAALVAHLGKQPGADLIQAAIPGNPGPIQSGRGELTNNPWAIGAAGLRAAYGFSTVVARRWTNAENWIRK